MAGKRLITVFGATGAQGGSVVNTFLNDPKLKSDWAVRAVTRDATKDSAKKLKDAGAEVVAADMNDKATLVSAMQGAAAVFAVTNYWEKMDAKLEVQQGKNLVDAAKETNVQQFIWSSLLNINKLSKGALPNVYHFDSKADVEEYAREVGIPATYFMPGFYMSNIPGGMFRRSPPNNAFTFALPVGPSAQIPLFDAADAGKYIKAAVLHRDELLGKRLLAATEYLTVTQIVEAFKKAFPEAGKDATFYSMPAEQFKGIFLARGMPDFAAQEFLENMLLLDQFGYYGGASLDETHRLVEDKLTTWDEHLRASKKWGEELK
ncbi:NmrA-like family-domain-containing protein [Cercophora newfieldiana]|uniref:NmrA-like family domain-containing protein 1 n=1 Tax=Cercophora newfieldiana TaxID=92897 RepID=A0AA39XV40_9PEZI|nr:NmrA-like family-domain-containing protein [Cercophora newfieldiana]